MNDPRLTAYVLGELEGKDLQEIEALVTSSPEARREVEKIRRMTGRLREELRVAPAAPASTFSAWRGLLAVALGLGVGVALAQWVFLPAKPTEEERFRAAHVLLDPPVATNSELATDVWSLSAAKDSLIVSAGMDKEGIYSTVSQGLPAVRNCYESRVPKDQQPSSDERFEWTVHKDGTYSEGGPLNGAFDKELAGCLQKALKTWQFPKGKSGKVQLSFAVQKRR